MDKKKLRIISDGTAANTQIYAGTEQLGSVIKIEFDPLDPGGLLTVHLTAIAELDVIAELTGVTPDQSLMACCGDRADMPFDGTMREGAVIDLDEPGMAERIANATITKIA